MERRCVDGRTSEKLWLSDSELELPFLLSLAFIKLEVLELLEPMELLGPMELLLEPLELLDARNIMIAFEVLALHIKE